MHSKKPYFLLGNRASNSRLLCPSPHWSFVPLALLPRLRPSKGLLKFTLFCGSFKVCAWPSSPLGGGSKGFACCLASHAANGRLRAPTLSAALYCHAVRLLTPCRFVWPRTCMSPDCAYACTLARLPPSFCGSARVAPRAFLLPPPSSAPPFSSIPPHRHSWPSPTASAHNSAARSASWCWLPHGCAPSALPAGNPSPLR